MYGLKILHKYGRKLKVRKFWELIPTFVKVTYRGKVGKEHFWPPILNRVKTKNHCFQQNHKLNYNLPEFTFNELMLNQAKTLLRSVSRFLNAISNS